METTGIKKQRDVPLMAFVICIALVLFVIIAQSWWSVREDRSLTLADAQQNSYFTVRILEEHAGRALSEALREMETIGAEIRQNPGTAEQEARLQKILRTQHQETQFIYAISVYNAAGLREVASRPAEQVATEKNPQSHSQIHIATLLKNPKDRGLAIGSALRLDESDLWILPVARNVYSEDGQLLAILEVTIRLAYFQDFYELVARGSAAAISLHDSSGNVLARAPFDKAYLDTPLTQSNVMKAITDASTEGSLQSGPLMGGAGDYLYTYRKITGVPLTLVYARNIDDILADWNGRVRQRTMFTATTVIFILVLAILLLIQLRRLQESKARFDASESRYRLLFSGAQDAILLISRDYLYVDCNPAAVTLLGLSNESQIIGKPVGCFSQTAQSVAGFAQTDRDELVRLLVDRAFAGVPQRFEWVMIRNGQPYYNEVSLSRVELNGEMLVFCVERDINSRKSTERLLEGQNRLLQLIGGNEDPIYILNAVCDFVQEMRPQWIAGIQLLSDDQRTFVQGVGKRFPEVLLDQLSGLPVTHGNGIWSEAVLVACPVQSDDLLSAPSMQFVNQLESISHLSSATAWPLMDKHGQVLGSFSLLFPAKPVLNDEDMGLIGIMIEIASIAIEGRRSEKKILQLAHYDELTGLPNRFLYNQHLAKALALAERNRSRLAVLFLDLDRFKNINDTFGHDEGDKVLRSVAQRFRHTLRESDIVARIGGDEFILLIDQFHEPRDLGDIADKLLYEASQPFEIDGQECQLSASIGIATFPTDGKDAQTLLKNADIAMYRAKNKGKDNYQFYASEMNTHTVERLAFEARLRKALERREFVVYYQPKIAVDSGMIVGAEALVRWNHPERGILYPNDFIMLAEEAGLIPRLGMLVLDIACRDVLNFRQTDPQFGRVAINLSGSQFNDMGLLEEVKSVVDFWRVPANALEFEITESMVMHNREQAIKLMDGFKDAGFTLSIDDFGTGYSSLAYLKRFPVDSVKVDRSFIKDIPDDPNDTAIVLAIVAMAHTLGLKVIAEGVDARMQLDTLLNFACDEYQGFYFSKAITAKDFQALLQKQVSSGQPIAIDSI